MSPRVASITELLNSLDATTYFFVSSGIFIAITAMVFFTLGVWLGGILWGRFKRRFRNAENVIESFKGEVALLKHRIAEQSTRHAPGAGPSPLQAIAFQASPPKPMPATPILEQLPAPSSIPRGRPFSVWTDPGWNSENTKPKEAPPAKPLTLVAEPPAKTAKTESGAPASPGTAYAPPLQPLFSPLEVFMVPRSRAFCIWTEEDWIAPVVNPAPCPPGSGFALWTLPDFQPACRGVQPQSRAHSVWTELGWAPSRQPGPPTRSARAFTVWTEPGWKPMFRLPWSRAFSVWTDPGWSPTPVTAQPLPPSASWSVWTAPSFVPACRGAHPPSRAHSLWTEEGWTPAPVAPQPRFVARPFSIWAELPPSIPAAAPEFKAPASQSELVAAAAATVATITAQPSAPTPAKSQGFVARALAAAKEALDRISGAVPVTPMPVPAPSEGSAASKPEPISPPPDAASMPTAKSGTPTTVTRAAPSPSEPSPAPVLVPARTSEPAKVTVKPSATPLASDVSLAATAAAVEALRQTGRVPVMTAPVPSTPEGCLPPSKAFTVWAGGPAFEPPTKITQRIALAALIESKVTGKIPLMPPAPVVSEPMVPPVPIVPAAKATAAASGSGAPAPSLLNLEPLVLPGETGNT